MDMSNAKYYVVGTTTYKERKTLIDFLGDKGKYVAVIDHLDGFKLIGIVEDGEYGYISEVDPRLLVGKSGYTMFSSIKDFMNAYGK